MTSIGDSRILPAASSQDGTYPRPQLMRQGWVDLSGSWEFQHDDEDRGIDELWFAQAHAFERTITVPFPPEAELSGIGATGFHPVVWYRRTITPGEIASLGPVGRQVILHFGAVDYRAQVWVDGQYLGSHQGGHTPFSFTLPARVDSSDPMVVVVRAEDDPLDVSQPRGKQDWQVVPHGIWYHRTSGIWQPVWLEAAPATRIASLGWSADVPAGTVELELGLNRRPAGKAVVSVHLRFGDETLAELSFAQTDPRSTTRITLPGQVNGQGYEALLWSPDAPRLIDAEVRVEFSDGSDDAVASYFGLRSTSWAGGHFLLNDRPCYIRAVLAQGYWAQSHLAAPSADALRAEVELARDMGFNTVRLHQKIEDPRFLYWADRLGLMVWGENASAFEFSATAVSRLMREWTETIHRDRSHPSIVAWVPLNESWGVQHLAHDPAQLDYTRSLYHLTKALDPGRPVISNDGWEHAESDFLTIHDYSTTGPELEAFYKDEHSVQSLMEGVGPLGRRMKLIDTADQGKPIVVSEFGGVSFAASSPETSWGYVTVSGASEYERALREQFEALQASPVLAGFCYTQLTDTLQEANGLAGEDRRPKLPLEVIRSIVHGDRVDISAHGRPKKPVEQPITVADSPAELGMKALEPVERSQPV
nr:glycoside hydrolase family 2 TIM barrel-domain containing protein [uncultured Arthrobacter sp.]